jgi:hypothetical protein
MQRKSTGQIRSTRARRRRSPPADHENFQPRGEQPAIQPINQLKDGDSRWSALQGLRCGVGGGGNCRWEYFTARHCYWRAEGHASGGSHTIKSSDCISSPRRNTAGAPRHTAQLSPQTCHASHISHISHIRGHHMQSDCMCLVFKREPAEGLKSMLCEVQSLWLKLVACCGHAVGGMLH